MFTLLRSYCLNSNYSSFKFLGYTSEVENLIDNYEICNRYLLEMSVIKKLYGCFLFD